MSKINVFNFTFCIFNFLTKQTHNPSICDISPQCACLQETTDLLSWASLAVNWELRPVAVKWELGKEGLEALPPDPAPHSYHTLTSCKSSTNPKKFHLLPRLIFCCHIYRVFEDITLNLGVLLWYMTFYYCVILYHTLLPFKNCCLRPDRARI